MFDIITDTYVLQATKNGKYMFKVFDPKYFNVVAFMVSSDTFKALMDKMPSCCTVHVRCFYNFKSIFGNLVSVVDNDTGEAYYSIT